MHENHKPAIRLVCIVYWPLAAKGAEGGPRVRANAFRIWETHGNVFNWL
jgi:hypothetical protein